MKKYLTFVFLILLVFCTALTVNAKSTDISDKAGLLQTLGIITEDEATETDIMATRGWFTDKLIKAMGYNSIVSDSDVPEFTDVPKNHYYYNSILTAKKIGLVNGNPDGTFSPDVPITYEQALVMSVNALGYKDYLSQQNGLFYAKYSKMAEDIGLTTGVKLGYNESLVASDAMSILYNLLHSGMYEERGIVFDYSYYEIGHSVLYNVHEIAYVEGVVKADQYASLSRTREGKGKLRIGDSIFTDITKTNMVGYNVRCYYDANSDSVNTTVYIIKYKNNDLSFNSWDVAASDSSSVTVNTGNRQKKYAFDSSLSVVYNGILLEDSNRLSTLLKADSTNIRMIDNNNDEIYDVVFINKYENVLVSRLDSSNKVLYGLNNEKIELDEDEKNFVFYDLDGNKMAFGNITLEYILSVCSPEEETGVTAIYVSKKTSDVVLDSKDSDMLYSGETEYIIAADPIKSFDDIELNLNNRLYYNVFGEVVYYIELEESDMTLAYIITGKSGSFGDIELKIFDEKLGTVNKNLKSSLKARLEDGTTKKYTAAEFFAYLTENSKFRMPVLYDVDKDGKISEIWFPSNNIADEFHYVDMLGDNVSTSDMTSFRYKSSNLSFISKVKMRDNTSRVLIVPKEGTAYTDESELFAVTTSKYFVNGKAYNCGSSGAYVPTPISMPKNSFVTDILVWQVDFSKSDTDKNNTIGIVTGFSQVYDSENNSEYTAISMKSIEGDDVKLKYQNTSSTGIIDENGRTISLGDIINYDLDALDQITDKTVTVFYDQSEEKLLKTVIGNTYYRHDLNRISTGEIIDREDNFVKIKVVNEYVVSSTAFNNEVYEVGTDTLVYICDLSNKEILTADKPAKISKDDKFICYLSGGTKLATVIYYE